LGGNLGETDAKAISVKDPVACPAPERAQTLPRPNNIAYHSGKTHESPFPNILKKEI
jgi:hypothetical protein